MRSDWTRRHFLHGTLGAAAMACGPSRDASPPRSDAPRIAAIEERIGGRVGVYAVDTATRRELVHRADERFAMCSTFKWVLAAAVLERVDRRELSLDERIAYDAAALLEHAPITEARVGEGALAIDVLAHAAVTVSDNTAANLLLTRIGGPAAVTRFARSSGDAVTRLDRTEPGLNEYVSGDPRDTTSPRAMALLMERVLCGDVLSVASRERLSQWLRACDTGKARLRAGFPSDWVAGDKTGTGGRGSANDVAIGWPPKRAPVLVAAYLSEGTADLSKLQDAHAEIGRLVAHHLGA